MDAKVMFWGAAVLNFVVLTGFAIAGIRQIRRGERARHRRSMLVAASLVGVFLVAYVLKLAMLGREALERWSAFDLWMLRFHELCVMAMLVGGGAALFLGGRLKETRLFTTSPDDPAPRPGDVARHRLAGRVAMGGAVLGVLSAGAVWLGMLGRAG
jgi:uncharacterized membrane protein YozB (DUF420 family)